MSTTTSSGADRLAPLLRLSAALFLAYLCVAVGLASLSVYVTRHLGLGNVAGGFAIGVAFLSTILTRAHAGSVADRLGPGTCLRRGLLIYVLASLVCLASAAPGLAAQPAYIVLVAGRVLLGLGESLAMVGAVSWGMQLMGPARSGRVLAFIGMAMYGALAAGGPLGLWLLGVSGFASVMVFASLVPLLAWWCVRTLPASVSTGTVPRVPFRQVLGRIWREGAVVGLQGVGFAALGAFVPLYFLAQGWPHAGLGLTAFGAGFVAVRLLAGHLPDRLGGRPVALCSLALEAVGQALLWLAPGPGVALAGALLTGVGCSMVFPAMGMEAVRRVPASLRGTAVGGFAMFQDIAYGVTGPLAGMLANRTGYASVFLAGAVCALLGWLLLAVPARAGASEARSEPS
ncbi:MFS transporter [Verticiella sediminum]|uniref:Uncharacterized MFS-type transporter FOZ76_13890 n=1 Tax=Verticiella sediminum TaxID=1247510 RepID=A0A556AKH7_9BURK|nr:MFS transporter [Verticiella sediminum]TSH93355.1 MFS transporter [Verticiella sediminum]